MGSDCQELPDLLAVSAVLAEAASLAGFSLPLEMPLDGFLPLEMPSSDLLLAWVLPLFERGSSVLPLLPSFEGTFRRVICLADSSLPRVASMPTAASRGSTSLMRLHSHLALLGHALSLFKPRSSATASSFLCNAEEVPVYSSSSSMNL